MAAVTSENVADKAQQCDVLGPRMFLILILFQKGSHQSQGTVLLVIYMSYSCIETDNGININNDNSNNNNAAG